MMNNNMIPSIIRKRLTRQNLLRCIILWISKAIFTLAERRLLTPVVVTNSSATSGGSVMLSDVELCNKSCCVLLLVDTSATRSEAAGN